MNIPTKMIEDVELAFNGRGTRHAIDAYVVSGFRKDLNRDLTDEEIDFLNNEEHDWVQEIAYAQSH